MLKEIESYTILILYSILSIALITIVGHEIFVITYDIISKPIANYNGMFILAVIIMLGSILYVKKTIKKTLSLYKDNEIPTKSYWYHKDSDEIKYIVISTFKVTAPLTISGNNITLELVVYSKDSRNYYVRTRSHFLSAFTSEIVQNNIKLIEQAPTTYEKFKNLFTDVFN